MTQPYGVPGPYVRGYHAGVDFGLPVGEPVYAAAEGTVAQLLVNFGEYGHLLILSHADEWSTYYAHLSSFAGQLQGQFVAAGQVVALSGNTGRSTGPHLHAELRHNGEPVDPGEEWA